MRENFYVFYFTLTSWTNFCCSSEKIQNTCMLNVWVFLVLFKKLAACIHAFCMLYLQVLLGESLKHLSPSFEPIGNHFRAPMPLRPLSPSSTLYFMSLQRNQIKRTQFIHFRQFFNMEARSCTRSVFFFTNGKICKIDFENFIQPNWKTHISRQMISN